MSEAEEVEGAEAEGEKRGESMNRSSSTNSVASLREGDNDEDSEGKLKDGDGEFQAREVN